MDAADRVARFLDTYGDTPLAPRLRNRWLDRLAREGRWSEYVAIYDPTDTNITRRCQYLAALIRTGNKSAAFAEAPCLAVELNLLECERDVLTFLQAAQAVAGSMRIFGSRLSQQSRSDSL